MSGGASNDARNPQWEEIERALAVVLELPEEQGAAYLAKLPGPVRVEVESLLAAHRRAGSFLGNETGAHPFGTNPQKPMAIKEGMQLGPYRIEAVIGEGGMGVVYRALDTRLNRPAAIKFLSDQLADEAARRRFQREAQMVSSLNHPHILTVYDAGDFEGCQYLVTEFIDGGTLKVWARTEKRTWREIVALLAGVADGLAAAHAAGILHRDIKPDNILVRKNGYAKLADFGLSKLEERSTPDAVTRTIASETTKRGMIVGTVVYMSPEQASGRPTDPRSDIFSFGVVLYELLAGRRPFQGKTDLETLQTIIHGSAPPLGDEFPIALRMVLEKAMEKDPAERYQSTRDLVVDLRRLTRQTGETSAPSATPPAPPRNRIRKMSAIAAGVLIALVLVAGALRWWLRLPAVEEPRQAVQFEIPQPPGTIFAPTISRQSFAISPDGKRLAFSATAANGTNIWIRDLASLDMRPVAGTEGVWSMFWSPDSRSIFFSVRKTLKQVNLDTGSGRTIAEIPSAPQLGLWRSNGDLVLYCGGGTLFELRLENGNLQKGRGFEGIRSPQFLPGGDRMIYAVNDGTAPSSHAEVSDYTNRKPVTLMQTDSRVQYAPPLRAGEPGYVVFIRGSSLLAQPFDASRVRVLGEPFSIAQNVIFYGPTLSANFSLSPNGVLIYQANFPVTELNWYDRSGKPVGAAGPPSVHWGQVRVSRDGRRVAATIWTPENGGTGIWIYDANGTRRLTFPPEVHRRGVWSPDGTRLAVGRSPTVGSPDLEVLDLAGGASLDFINESPKEHLVALPTDWSPDGRFIALDDGVGEEQHTAWIADVGSRKMRPFLRNDFAQWGVAFAPDGKRIAFVSMESGRPEVYVQPFESTPSPHVAGEPRQVSRDGAWLVRWRADGRELFYLGMNNVLYAMPVDGSLKFGDPNSLFRIAGAPQFATTRDFQFDVSPDGQRFVLPTTGSVPPPPFTVIENWQDKFRR